MFKIIVFRKNLKFLLLFWYNLIYITATSSWTVSKIASHFRNAKKWCFGGKCNNSHTIDVLQQIFSMLSIATKVTYFALALLKKCWKTGVTKGNRCICLMRCNIFPSWSSTLKLRGMIQETQVTIILENVPDISNFFLGVVTIWKILLKENESKNYCKVN